MQGLRSEAHAGSAGTVNKARAAREGRSSGGLVYAGTVKVVQAAAILVPRFRQKATPLYATIHISAAGRTLHPHVSDPWVTGDAAAGRAELYAELHFDGPAEKDPPAAGAGAGLQLTGDARSLIFEAV